METGLPQPLFDAILRGMGNADADQNPQAILAPESLLEVAARARLLVQSGGNAEIATTLAQAATPDLSNHTSDQILALKDTILAEQESADEMALRKCVARVKSRPKGGGIKALRKIMQMGRADVLRDLSQTVPEDYKDLIEDLIYRAGGDTLRHWHVNARPLDQLRISMRSVFTDRPKDVHAQEDLQASVRVLMATDQKEAALALASSHIHQIETSQALAVSMARTLFQLIPWETQQSEDLMRAKDRLAPFERFRFLWMSEQSQPEHVVPIIIAAGQGHDLLRLSRNLVPTPVDTLLKDETVEALNDLLDAISGRAGPAVVLARQLGFEAAPRLKPLADAKFSAVDLAGQSTVAPAFDAALKNWRREGRGLMMISSHNTPRPPWNYLPPIAAAEAGFDTVTIVKEKRAVTADAGRYLPSDENGVVWTSATGRLRELARRDTSEAQQVAEFMALLRNGGAIHMSPDGAFMPSRVRAYVPWFLRNYFLPVFAAQLAISSGAAVVYTQSWRSREGQRISDGETVDCPPEQGSLAVRSIWLTQRIARAARRFHRRTGAPLDTAMLYNYGGAPVPPPTRSTPHDAATLTCWITQEQTDAPALICANRTLGRADLAQFALRLATLLQEAQSEHPTHHAHHRRFGDQFRLFGCLPQGEALLALGLAAHATGTLFSPCQSDTPADQIARRIADLRPHLAIATAESWSAVLAADPDMALVPVLIVEGSGDQSALEDLCDGYLPASDLPPVAPDQPGFVVYTSGSTGQPKGIVVPAGALEGTAGLDRLTPLGPKDRVSYVLRWDTVGFIDLLACLRGGASLAVADPETIAKPRAMWDWLARQGVSFVSAPVTVWRYLSQSVPEVMPPAFKGGLLWGERVPAPLIAQLEKVCPKCRFYLNFGASECTYIGFGEIRSDLFDAFKGGPGGTLLDDRIAEIVDEDGTPVKAGKAGLLRLTAPAVMLGLFGNLVARNDVVNPEDWPATALIGNHVRLLPEGIDVLGRADDVIKIAGRRTTVSEVDSAVESVDGVSRSCTFVVEEGDGEVWLAVAAQVDEPTNSALIEGIADRIATRLFAAARPRRVVLFEDFMRLPTGKLDMTQLRRTVLEHQTDDVREVEQAPLKADMHDAIPPPTALSKWARSRGFCAAVFDPNAQLPSFSSIDHMELHLLAEEMAGAPRHDPLDLENARTWADLEAVLMSKP